MSTEAWALAAAIVTMAVMSAAGIVYARTRRQTIEDFVSARGSIGGMTAMATMAASLLGAWILFSPAEAATWAGMAALIGYGVGQAAPIVAFTVVGPRMRKLAPNGHSLSEFVWQRYGRAMYLLTLLIVVLYMFTFLAAEMGAIARPWPGRRRAAPADARPRRRRDARLHRLRRSPRLHLHRQHPVRHHRPPAHRRPRRRIRSLRRLDRGLRFRARGERRAARRHPAARHRVRPHPRDRHPRGQPLPPGTLAARLRRQDGRRHLARIPRRGRARPSP